MTLKRAGRLLPSDLHFLRRGDKVGRKQAARRGRSKPLSVELCESRCLLAADISGIKFQDLTGDGFSGDDVPLGGFNIQLYKDDGDGIFNDALDTLVDVQATNNVNGGYTFSNVDDGLYFIREIVPPLYVQTGGPEYYTVLVKDSNVFNGNTLTIDDFELPDPGSTYVITFNSLDPTLIKHTVGGVIGGQRDVLINVSGVSGATSAAGSVGFSGGQGVFEGIFNTPGSTATLQYDGLDADIVGPPASLVNALGLTSDLTNGGVNTGFRFDFLALDVGSGSTLDIVIELTGPGGTASYSGTIGENLNPFVEFISFGAFSTTGTFAFDDVSSINIILNPPNILGAVDPNVDLVLDGIFTDRVQPRGYNFANFLYNPQIVVDKNVVDASNCVADVDGNGVVQLSEVGDVVNFTYSVSNPGNVALDFTLTDDNGTPGDVGDDFNPTPVLNGAFNVGDTNTDGLLTPGEVWQFTFSKPINTPGLYTNIATAVGQAVDGNGDPIDNVPEIIDIDDASVYVVELGLNIEKRVNSQDANAEPPAFDHVLVGTAVNYSYLVTNTSNVILNLADFLDDNGTPGDIGDDFTPSHVLVGGFNIGDANQNNLFDPGESWEFEQLNVVLNTVGLHTNTVTITGSPVDANGNRIACLEPLVATDPANIYVDQPAIDLTKIVVDPGCIADVDGQGAVPIYHPGDVVTYQYTITNLGTTPLLIDLADLADNGTPLDPSDDIVTELIIGGVAQPGATLSGDTNLNGLLDIDEIWTVTFDVSPTVLGHNVNVGEVTGIPTDATGTPLTGFSDVADTDNAVIYLATSGISLEKRVNGQDANVEPPAFGHVQAGTPVNYTYLVTNTGNVVLSLVNFVDDNGTPGDVGDDFTPTPVLNGGFNIGDANQNGLFDPGETWEFEQLGVVLTTVGLHTNTASVTGAAVDINGNRIGCLDPVTDTDPANIYVSQTGIDLTKVVFDPDCVADVDGQGAVPVYDPGDVVVYQYTLNNTGTTALLVDLVDVADNGTPVNPADDITTDLIIDGVAQPGVTISGDTDLDGLLDVGETWIVTFTTVINPLGYNTNEAEVTGTPVDSQGNPLTGFTDVTDTDDAVVYVGVSGIQIEKRVNGQDANVEPPPFQHVLAGNTVSYTYLVTNTGNVILDFVSFIDDNGTPGDAGDDFTPTPVLKPNMRNIGDANNNNKFDPGETWEFERINHVIDANTPAGPWTNTATVVADPVDFQGNVIDCVDQVTASDPATIIVDPLLSSLAGFVYKDCNNNGIYEPGTELPIANVTVQLYQNNVLVASTVTDAFGRYLFDNLVAGTYEIREVQPAGYLDGKESLDLTPGSPTANFVVETGNIISDKFTDIVLAAGVDGANYNFAELGPSSIAGCVYVDVNNNGVMDGAESPIAGVKITLTGTDDRGNVINTVVYTDLNGKFIFENLRPADQVGYTLKEEHPVQFVDGKDHAGSAGGVVNSGLDEISQIMLGACTTATGYCFGEYGLIVPSKRPFIFTNGGWQNQSNVLDVNADGRLTGQDALIVIDALNRLGIGELPTNNGTPYFPDVNGDQVLSPADLLQIINQLNVDSRSAPNGSGHASNSVASGLLADTAFSELEAEAEAAAAVATSKSASTASQSSTSTSSTSTETVSIPRRPAPQKATPKYSELVDIAFGLATSSSSKPSDSGNLYSPVGKGM